MDAQLFGANFLSTLHNTNNLSIQALDSVPAIECLVSAPVRVLESLLSKLLKVVLLSWLDCILRSSVSPRIDFIDNCSTNPEND